MSKIEITRNKRDMCDMTDPPKYSGRLLLGTPLPELKPPLRGRGILDQDYIPNPENDVFKTLDEIDVFANLDFYADGETKEEVRKNIQKQVEREYRKLMREKPNLGGRALKVNERRIENIRKVYAPPHPIKTTEDAVRYHRLKSKEDYISCGECYDMFHINKTNKREDGALTCPTCGSLAESWSLWGGRDEDFSN